MKIRYFYLVLSVLIIIYIIMLIRFLLSVVKIVRLIIFLIGFNVLFIGIIIFLVLLHNLRFVIFNFNKLIWSFWYGDVIEIFFYFRIIIKLERDQWIAFHIYSSIYRILYISIITNIIEKLCNLRLIGRIKCTFYLILH